MELIGWAVMPAEAGTSAAGAMGTAATGRSYAITLVTGDLMHFTDPPGSRDVVTVDPADKNAGGVQVQTQGDDTYVVPTQATPLLAADKLDKRLLNVTELVAMGYDDAYTLSASSVTVSADGTAPVT